MRILKIKSLPSTKESIWIDRDFIMIHACFQILEDCVEKENVDTEYDYESNKDFVDEVRFLYNWWQIRKTKDEIDDDELKDDDEMLSRLMKIRTQLWI